MDATILHICLKTEKNQIMALQFCFGVGWESSEQNRLYALPPVQQQHKKIPEQVRPACPQRRPQLGRYSRLVDPLTHNTRVIKTNESTHDEILTPFSQSNKYV
jgi:hypothetical protein